MDIAGNDPALSMPPIRDMDRFASRSRAHIQRKLLRTVRRHLADQHGTLILHLDPSLLKGLQICQSSIRRNVQSIGKHGSFLHRHILPAQARHDLFPALTGQITAHRRLMILVIKTAQDPFRAFLPIAIQEILHDPLRHGIPYAEMAHRIIFSLRIDNIILKSGNVAQHTVDKILQWHQMARHGQFDRLIAGRTVRHLIHIEDLIHRHAQQIADHRFHPGNRRLGIAVQNIVHFHTPLHRAADQSVQKSAVSRIQLRMAV